MKRVLLEHCVPQKVRLALRSHEVKLTIHQGWSQLANGELLNTAEGAGFEVFVTADKNLRYQQNLAGRRIAIVLLPTNTLSELIPLFPKIDLAVTDAQAGAFVEIQRV